MATMHALTMSGIRQRYLKDLYTQWRGVLAAYDEGLASGDAVLAGAVWRNVFKGSEDMAGDVEKVAGVVGYLRREIERVDMNEADVVTSPEWKFEGLKGYEAALDILKVDSRLLEEPFETDGDTEKA